MIKVCGGVGIYLLTYLTSPDDDDDDDDDDDEWSPSCLCCFMLRKTLLLTLTRRLGEFQSHSGHYGEEYIFYLH